MFSSFLIICYSYVYILEVRIDKKITKNIWSDMKFFKDCLPIFFVGLFLNNLFIFFFAWQLTQRLPKITV